MDNSVKIWDLQSEALKIAIDTSFTEPHPQGRPFATQIVQKPIFSTSQVQEIYIRDKY